jgi:hypothetical protein
MLRPAASLALACATLLAATLPASAQEDNAAMPKTLVVGYEEEGEVDDSTAACRAFVTETVEWEKAEMEQAVKDVCAMRRKHVEAYAALQSSFAAFREVLQEATRYDGPAAARNIAGLIKSCIDFKWALSTGGHNIGIDMMPNSIATECLGLGRELIDKETSALEP